MAGGVREQLREALRRSPGLGRLLAVKLVGQFGDGLFQAALGGAILFDPERRAAPTAIAAGFAVLLLPYSVLGPFAGALLDRWDRRAVLLWAGLLRALLILVTALLLGGGASTGAVLLLALAAVGVSRFVAAGVSASLPRVVAPELLVTTNSIIATVGSACTSIGAGAAVVVLAVAGSGDTASSIAVAVSSVGSLLSALFASRFARHQLGPDDAAAAADASRAGSAVEQLVATARALGAGLANGARAVWQAPGVTTVMAGIGAHRIVFGVDTLVMVLILRGPAEPGSSETTGLAGFGVAVTSTAAGMLLAAVATPLLLPRLGRTRTVVLGLAVALAVQLTLVASLDRPELLVAAFLLGLAGQVVKLTGDAAMQTEIPDVRRGQVFALQDTIFNMAFVIALAVAAALVPADGHSRPVVLGAGACYALALVAVGANSRRPAPAAG